MKTRSGRLKSWVSRSAGWATRPVRKEQARKNASKRFIFMDVVGPSLGSEMDGSILAEAKEGPGCLRMGFGARRAPIAIRHQVFERVVKNNG